MCRPSNNRVDTNGTFRARVMGIIPVASHRKREPRLYFPLSIPVIVHGT